ncbi:hypothetical protein M8542_23370 [Amycolatopsis sp. OK19-0408]|uniref:Uncharacterized protein n=1 Tax=Amycolatopsis iheyensis TaxID=2945988 RepID=A0A9X2SKS2_9PSEU|nr:hypothetical protein [Amycolatopsis iheyensis]MCR6485769.1 hypothetical protein [Amycolatopsis iheyensis]
MKKHWLIGTALAALTALTVILTGAHAGPAQAAAPQSRLDGSICIGC